MYTEKHVVSHFDSYGEQESKILSGKPERTVIMDRVIVDPTCDDLEYLDRDEYIVEVTFADEVECLKLWAEMGGATFIPAEAA